MMRAQFSKQFQSSFRSATSEDSESTSTLESLAAASTQDDSYKYGKSSGRPRKRESRWNKSETEPTLNSYDRPENRSNYRSHHSGQTDHSNDLTESKDSKSKNYHSSESYSNGSNCRSNNLPPKNSELSWQSGAENDDDSKFKVPALPILSFQPQPPPVATQQESSPSYGYNSSPSQSLGPGDNGSVSSKPPQKKKSRWDVC